MENPEATGKGFKKIAMLALPNFYPLSKIRGVIKPEFKGRSYFGTNSSSFSICYPRLVPSSKKMSRLMVHPPSNYDRQEVANWYYQSLDESMHNTNLGEKLAARKIPEDVKVDFSVGDYNSPDYVNEASSGSYQGQIENLPEGKISPTIIKTLGKNIDHIMNGLVGSACLRLGDLNKQWADKNCQAADKNWPVWTRSHVPSIGPKEFLKDIYPVLKDKRSSAKKSSTKSTTKDRTSQGRPDE